MVKPSVEPTDDGDRQPFIPCQLEQEEPLTCGCFFPARRRRYKVISLFYPFHFAALSTLLYRLQAYMFDVGLYIHTCGKKK